MFAFILNAFFFTCFCPFFHKFFLQVYIEEAGEGTSPILSFLHPFVMIWKKKLSAESNIFAREAQNSPDIYAYLLFYHYDLCLINLPAPVNEAIKYIMHTSKYGGKTIYL